MNLWCSPSPKLVSAVKLCVIFLGNNSYLHVFLGDIFHLEEFLVVLDLSYQDQLEESKVLLLLA